MAKKTESENDMVRISLDIKRGHLVWLDRHAKLLGRSRNGQIYYTLKIAGLIEAPSEGRDQP